MEFGVSELLSVEKWFMVILEICHLLFVCFHFLYQMFVYMKCVFPGFMKIFFFTDFFFNIYYSTNKLTILLMHRT